MRKNPGCALLVLKSAYQNYPIIIINLNNYVRIFWPLGPPQTRVKNAKQMRNTKQNCFSHSSASPRNDKQCSAKQCFANQTNRCLAGFASRSDLFRDNARLTKYRRKVYQRYLILQAMYTTIHACDLRYIVDWLFHTCFAENLILESSNVFFLFRSDADEKLQMC